MQVLRMIQHLIQCCVFSVDSVLEFLLHVGQSIGCCPSQLGRS